MIKGVVGALAMKELRVCVYGPPAELVYGYVRKGSRLGVIGHIQQRTTRKGDLLRSSLIKLSPYETWMGKQVNVRKELVQRGLLRPSLKAAVNMFPYTIYTTIWTATKY